MPDWDTDSPRLRRNLKKLLASLRDQAVAREKLCLEDAKKWHHQMMEGLASPGDHMIGRFRGSSGVGDIEVYVGSYPGVAASRVASQAAQFQKTLQQLIEHLDHSIRPGSALNPDELSAVIEACAWVHGEWVRIHPFANGNGRTARLWANAIAMRYNLPPFVQLRPRPNFGYEAASGEAMLGNRRPTVQAFHQMLNAFLT